MSKSDAFKMPLLNGAAFVCQKSFAFSQAESLSQMEKRAHPPFPNLFLLQPDFFEPGGSFSTVLCRNKQIFDIIFMKASYWQAKINLLCFYRNKRRMTLYSKNHRAFSEVTQMGLTSFLPLIALAVIILFLFYILPRRKKACPSDDAFRRLYHAETALLGC